MENTAEVIKHFKKLERTITNNADFSFGKIKLIKKNLIDDVLACILALLPQKYRTYLKTPNKEKEFLSILSYRLMFNAIKNKFFFSQNVYLVYHKDAVKYINTFIKDFERDIKRLEQE